MAAAMSLNTCPRPYATICPVAINPLSWWSSALRLWQSSTVPRSAQPSVGCRSAASAASSSPSRRSHSSPALFSQRSITVGLCSSRVLYCRRSLCTRPFLFCFSLPRPIGIARDQRYVVTARFPVHR